MVAVHVGTAQEPKNEPPAQPLPVNFAEVMAKMKADKPAVEKRHQTLLNDRYDLANKTTGEKMSAGRRDIQVGVRVKLPEGVTWKQLADMTPDEVREKGVYPKGFLPLPHPHHQEGGMVFPKFHIDEIKKQEGRDLTRFDLDFDIPDLFLPEFPPPIYLTTRPDLGDVSKGQLVTIENFFEMFKDILNSSSWKALAAVDPMAQQQFNATTTRGARRPTAGSPASTVTRTATRTARTTSSATFGRRNSGTGSKPRRSVG